MSGIRLWFDLHDATLAAILLAVALGLLGWFVGPRGRVSAPVTLVALLSAAAVAAGDGRLETFGRALADLDHADRWALTTFLVIGLAASDQVRKPRHRRDWRGEVRGTALLLGLLAVLAITLDRGSASATGAAFTLVPGSLVQATYDTAPNIVLFLPLAYLARLDSRTWWGVLAFLAAVSVVLELVQIPLGRSAQALDVAANVAGAAIGCAFAHWQVRGAARTERGQLSGAREDEAPATP
ncbi:MAG: VanZ family protein [Kineosporiaceae bacterium]